MTRPFNFGAGPAVLPEPVLERAREELLDWHGAGMSVMEMSHRGREFMSIAEQAQTDLRRLLEVPDDYRILFLQGGASAQFAMVPLNLLREGGNASYVETGSWSRKAIAEGQRLGRAHVVASSAADRYRSIPPLQEWTRHSDADFLHYTPNETIEGVEFHWVPETEGVPLVADMSSTLLSRPLAVARFGLIYAGAQKNLGPAGLTVVIVREELLGRALPGTPVILDYAAHASHGSMYNTPPTFCWYLAGLVFAWVEEEGGLTAMAERNERKAQKLYSAIDKSDFYSNPVRTSCRSWMNVPFTLAAPNLDDVFLREAAQAGLLNLKGHRSVGGMRASIYNAMPEAGIDALVDFMAAFERHHG